jgi:nucleotide-binding universal stress UspA family protein
VPPSTPSSSSIRPASPLALDNEVHDVASPHGSAVVAAAVDAAREHGVPVEGHVLKGVPAETIVEYADANGVDLVVMATHGRSGLARGLFGSVTEGVIRRSTVPVLTVRREPGRTEAGP